MEDNKERNFFIRKLVAETSISKRKERQSNGEEKEEDLVVIILFFLKIFEG